MTPAFVRYETQSVELPGHPAALQRSERSPRDGLTVAIVFCQSQPGWRCTSSQRSSRALLRAVAIIPGCNSKVNGFLGLSEDAVSIFNHGDMGCAPRTRAGFVATRRLARPRGSTFFSLRGTGCPINTCLGSPVAYPPGRDTARRVADAPLSPCLRFGVQPRRPTTS